MIVGILKRRLAAQVGEGGRAVGNVRDPIVNAIIRHAAAHEPGMGGVVFDKENREGSRLHDEVLARGAGAANRDGTCPAGCQQAGW
jgi:hypothetical protein